MCIISGPIRDVSSTKIFVLPNVDFSRQMTVYSNSVDSPGNNLMILPVPNSRTIQFHEMKYEDLFQDLMNSVCSNSFSISASASAPTRGFLQVFEHASYYVSVAHSVEELFQLDTAVFRLTDDLYKFFRHFYDDGFGFVCCVLRPGIRNYEPLCYSHGIQGDRLFVPTRHYHVETDGSVDTFKADWDHLIFSAATKKSANRNYDSYPENAVAWSRLHPEFRWNEEVPIRCMEIKGMGRNYDVVLETMKR